MSRISIRHSHPRPCSGAKILRRCRNNEDADNVPYIDVDSDFVENVIILDFPESSARKKQCPSLPKKDKKGSYGNVIYIDDDEIPENNHSTGLNDVNFSAATSLNGHGSKNIADTTPVRLSKGKRTYSGKFCPRNRYGLDSDSESNSSDHDCELVVDVSGEVQEEWQKAFSRRKKDTHSHRDDEDQHKNFCRKNKEPLFRSSTENCYEKDDPSTSRTKGDTSSHHTPLSDDHNVHDLETDCDYTNSNAPGTSNSHAPDSPSILVDPPDCMPGSARCHIKERGNHHGLSHSAFRKQCTKEFDHLSPGSRNKDTSKLDDVYCNEKSSSLEDDAPICKRNKSFQTEFMPSTSFQTSPLEDDGPTYKRNSSFQTDFRPPSASFPGEDHMVFQDHLQSRQPHGSGSAKDIENLIPDKQTDHCGTPPSNAAGSVFGEPLLSKCCWDSGDGILKGTYQKNSVENVHLNEAKHWEYTSLPNILQEEDKDGHLHSQNGETLPTVEKDNQQNSENGETFPTMEKDKVGKQNSENGETLPSGKTTIINEREKHKETDDYKRATEEEWASRQQALLAQAEEAQRLKRLRKRKKAESMRLLDMERRQKERIEEMRNAQKKDEENMNLKEKIRAEIRTELKKLEIVCPNMASLLHMLGIRVDSWPTPTAREVQAAYKRALLTFHPDRASKSDVRQQVEAEEKFKLINRLKEKFSPSI